MPPRSKRTVETASQEAVPDNADVAAVAAVTAAAKVAEEIKEIGSEARAVAKDSNERIKTVEAEVRKPLVKRLAMLGLVLLALYGIVSGLLQSRQNGETLDEYKAAQDVIVKNNESLSKSVEYLSGENALLFQVAQEQSELLRAAGIEPVDPFDPGVIGPGTSPGRVSPPGTTQSTPSEDSESPSGGSSPRSSTPTSPEPQAAPSGPPAPAPSPSATTPPGVTIQPPDVPLVPPLPPVEVVVPDLPLLSSAVSPAITVEKENRMDPNLINPWLSLVALVLPIIVGAVTNGGASSTVKGWTLAVLSGVTALVAEFSEVLGDGLNFSSREVANNLLLVFVTAVVAYKGGLVREVATKVSNATADKGIGTPVRPLLRDPQTGRFRSRGADL